MFPQRSADVGSNVEREAQVFFEFGKTRIPYTVSRLVSFVIICMAPSPKHGSAGFYFCRDVAEVHEELLPVAKGGGDLTPVMLSWREGTKLCFHFKLYLDSFVENIQS